MTAVPAPSYPGETAVESPVRGRRHPLDAAAVQWLVAGCYLFGAVVVTGHLWGDPTRQLQYGDVHDVDLFAWYLRYAATALQHGHLPALVTNALNAPQGVNLMWQTSFLLPGIVLAPVTLLAGPQFSLTVVLTLGLAGSAASLFFVLRRWGASVVAAGIGGAVYGFSPALVNSGIGHYQFEFAVLPPLMVHVLLRILAGRGRAVVNGTWLGVLAAAQFFTGSELLIDTAVAGVVLIVVIGLSRPRAAVERGLAVMAGLGTAAGVALVVCGYPLWVQFFGPLAEHHAPQGPWSGDLGFFVDAPSTLMFHTAASAAVGAHYGLGLAEFLSYLGWPLIAVLVVATVWSWRDLRVRAAAVVCLMCELLSLGGGTLPIRGLAVPGWLLPFHWVQGLPVISQVLPDRFCILADAAAGAVLAFSLDRARSALGHAWGPGAGALPVLAAALVVLPLLPLPYQTARVTPVPAGYQATFARLHLPPAAAVLVVPVPDVLHTQAMRWQATTGQPAELVGGYFLAPGPGRQPTFYNTPGDEVPADSILYQLWTGQPVPPSAIVQVRAALAYWKPAAIVAVTVPGTRLADFLTTLLGHPTLDIGAVLAWRR
jgi:hypothetical protein